MVSQQNKEKKAADLTEENFNLFLDMLSTNREEAGRKYETLRHKIINYFLMRGMADPEELADKTFDNTMHWLAKHHLHSNYINNIDKYLLGVARNIAYESLRNSTRTVPVVEAHNVQVGLSSEQENDFQESLHNALQKALNDLSESARELIRAYYETGNPNFEHRRKVADRLGLSINALRIRVHRINEHLRYAIKDYLAQEEGSHDNR